MSGSPSSTLSVHLGPRSHLTGCLLWSVRQSSPGSMAKYALATDEADPVTLPKCVFIDEAPMFHQFEAPPKDMDGEAFLWDGKVDEVRQHRGSSAAYPSLQHLKWHHRTPIRMQQSDLAPDRVRVVVEQALDSLRYFAEASDRVDCVDVQCDSSVAFNPFSAQILNDLRDDYGSGVALPVCLFGGGDSLGSRSELATSIVGNQTADMLLPVDMDAPEVGAHHTTALRIAVALHTTLSFRTAATPVSTWQWMGACTKHSRMQCCLLEAFVPMLTHSSLAIDSNPTTIHRQLIGYLESSHTTSPSLNPFALPLGATVFVSPRGVGEIFSNVVTWRSSPTLSIGADLFRQSRTHDHPLSSLMESAEDCILQMDLLAGETATGSMQVSGSAAAVGTASCVGDGLRALAATLPALSREEEQEDVDAGVEYLLGLAESYDRRASGL